MLELVFEWYGGAAGLTPWQIVAVTLVMTQITIVSVTLYLHRHSAHNSLDLHPVLKHFFRFWLWLATSQNTKEWTAIHRKHHAKCETDEDPHSPVVLGINKVLFEGAELYHQAATPETLERYGQRTPEDWVECNVYSKHRMLGIALMAVIDVLLFGVYGITVWAVQMMWIPVFAAGVINGLGHHVGYRNYECSDNSRNLVPWGLLIGGEELHNNHHTYPNSSKLSRRAWEFDIGWFWIQLFRAFGLAHPKGVAPIGGALPGKDKVDVETLQAIINNRYQIMVQYRKTVLEPAFRQQKEQVAEELRPLFRRAKKLLYRDVSLIKPDEKQRLETLLETSAPLSHLYEKGLELQRLWCRQAGLKSQERIAALMEWCRHAEASGVKALEDFAITLRSYSLSPVQA